mmetsp:Transcript_14962/g.46819  ORF Transcript_14962/g.46819 Transcript_14962/m.46819 type:complete len:135 (+) Transcript_14962:137-541(+)
MFAICVFFLAMLVRSLSASTATLLAASSSALFIPTNVRHDDSHLLHTAIRALVGIGGGVSVTSLNGFWQNDAGLLVEDDVSMLEVAVDLDDELRSEMWDLAEWLAVQLDQEAVLLRMDKDWFLAKQPAAELVHM